MSNATEFRLPSERRFGIAFTISLSVLGVYAALRNWGWLSCAVALIGSAIIGVITLVAPAMLAPLNRGWFYVGKTMEKVVSPVVLGVLFFVLLAPIAFVARLLGRDELKLKKRAVGSYWVNRTAPESNAHSFRNQF